MNSKKTKNGNRLKAFLLRYGVLVSTIPILATLSIRLQDFANYFIATDAWLATSTVKENALTEIFVGDPGPKRSTTDTADASSEKTIESNSMNNASNDTIIDRYGNQQNSENAASDGTQRGEKLLEVVWLMSFPNSGTTYTNHLIQGYTNTTTATNYGQEQSTYQESVPIFPESPDGPFFRYSSWSPPPRYVLTKTHCGGECDACQIPNGDEYIDSVEAFERACCTGKRISNGTKVRTIYSSAIPKKAVHLIRDPFDNVVARLHLKERRWQRHRNETKYEERVGVFNGTKDGFLAYCRFRDKNSFKVEFRRRTLSGVMLENAVKVPCYAEFVTYTRWHNHAIRLVARRGMPVMTLFYEDYASRWDATVDNLLGFLRLKPAPGAEAEEFIIGKHYDEFYSEEQKRAAVSLMREIASTELSVVLQRYLS
mmetsp:Transcript_12161/g.28871  ORF Transcript_12161/g.28871 Transcript_12161/m.28871 type:complete len:427 (-) Transcript_12161:478-1758(-)